MYSVLNILFFYLVGAIVSKMINGFVPASVIGMVLLFLSLVMKWVKPEKIKPAADFLLSNLLLFFVPVACGVVGAYVLFKDYIWAILVSSIVSTVIVIVVVGGIAQILIKRRSK